MRQAPDLPPDDAVQDNPNFLKFSNGAVAWEATIGFEQLPPSLWPYFLGEFPMKVDFNKLVAPRLTRFLRSRVGRMLARGWRGLAWFWDNVIMEEPVATAIFLLGTLVIWM